LLLSGGVQSSPPLTPEQPGAGLPVVPDNAPAPEPEPPPPALAEKKLPVPSKEAQAEVSRQLDEIYDFSEATTPEQKLKLARELFALGKKSEENAVERFTLLRKAMELAGDGGNADLMSRAVDAIGDDFEIDVLVVKGKMLKKFAAGATDAARVHSFMRACRGYIDEAAAQERYDLALNIAKLAYRTCLPPVGRKFRKETLDRRRQIEKLHDDHQKVQQALAAFAADPNDAKANLFLGRLYCFTQGDWQFGLPYLARGSDAQLKVLAQQELVGATDPDAQVLLGDGWWNLSEKEEGTAERRCKARAAHWYKQALPELCGPTKATPKERVSQWEKEQSAQHDKPATKRRGQPKEQKSSKELLAGLVTRLDTSLQQVASLDTSAKREQAHARLIKEIDHDMRKITLPFRFPIRDIEREQTGYRLRLGAPAEAANIGVRYRHLIAMRVRISQREALQTNAGDTFVISGTWRFAGGVNTVSTPRTTVVMALQSPISQQYYTVYFQNWSYTIEHKSDDQ